MDQSLRNWYLSSLGVVQYLPRGAETNQVKLTPTAFEESQSLEHASSAVVSRKHHRILDELQEKEASTSSTVREVNTQQVETPVDTAIQLRLAFWQPCDRLVVLSSLPAGMRPGAGQLTMLNRLLKAINALESELPAFDLIDWPQTGGGTGALKDARDFIAVFLEAKAFLKPFSHVLLMGVDSAMVASTANSPQVGDQLTLPCTAKGIVTHSLYDMDADTSLKGATWEAIKFLADH